MFAVPNPPPMLSKTEVDNFYGKLRTLATFKRHPMAKHPKLQAPMQHLSNSLHINLMWQNFYYRKDHRQRLDDILRCVSALEDVLIQVIIQGKDFDEVIARESAKPEKTFLKVYKK